MDKELETKADLVRFSVSPLAWRGSVQVDANGVTTVGVWVEEVDGGDGVVRRYHL